MIKYNGEKVLCMCEGNFELELMNILIDNDLLMFSRSDLVEDKIIKRQSARNLERNYLNRRFDNGLILIRVIDSSNEKLPLGKAYINKFTNSYIVNTKPEAEILIIIDKGDFEIYTQKHESKTKPSTYCKKRYNYKNIKREGFIKNYFKNISKLLQVLKEYKRVSNQDNPTIYDLLK